jgi:hypothetical protein
MSQRIFGCEGSGVLQPNDWVFANSRIKWISSRQPDAVPAKVPLAAAGINKTIVAIPSAYCESGLETIAWCQTIDARWLFIGQRKLARSETQNNESSIVGVLREFMPLPANNNVRFAVGSDFSQKQDPKNGGSVWKEVLKTCSIEPGSKTFASMIFVTYLHHAT